MSHKITIAIDGYSSCGKSTTAKMVAKQLGYAYIDTGAMYRAVTLYFLENHISLTNPKEIKSALDQIQITFRVDPETGENTTYLNGVNIEKEIRKMYISENVSQVAALVEVRRAMVAQQQKMGKSKGVILDGRDVGTVVFPNAELKVFMTAQPEIRAERRQQELLAKGEMVPFDEVLKNLAHRDHLDTTREEGPLRQADDALVLDNTYLSVDEQVELVVNWVDQIIAKKIRKEQ